MKIAQLDGGTVSFYLDKSKKWETAADFAIEKEFHITKQAMKSCFGAMDRLPAMEIVSMIRCVLCEESAENSLDIKQRIKINDNEMVFVDCTHDSNYLMTKDEALEIINGKRKKNLFSFPKY